MPNPKNIVALRTAAALGVALGWAGVALAQEVTPGANGGERLYEQYCATCHGLDLEGQPDWMSALPSGRLPAPPHDASGHTWHHPDRVLVDIIQRGTAAVVGGGYESDMPAFGNVLSEAETNAVLDYIKSSWPDRERSYQEDRTRADEAARK